MTFIEHFTVRISLSLSSSFSLPLSLPPPLSLSLSLSLPLSLLSLSLSLSSSFSPPLSQLKGLLQHFLTKGFKNNIGGKKGGETNKGPSNSSSSPPSLSPSCYSPAGLSYLHSLHSLNVLGHLLLYSQGREVIGTVLLKINNNGKRERRGERGGERVAYVLDLEGV